MTSGRFGLSWPFQQGDTARLSPQNQESSAVKKTSKNSLDNRRGIGKVRPIVMKNNQLTTILLGLLTISALASVVLCWLYISSTRQKNSMEFNVKQMNQNRYVMSELVKDTLEYSKTHPAIDPILESLRLKAGKSVPTTTNKPVTK
jgi:hypothetical protein